MAISRRYTSGAKSAWNAVFHPNVTRQENRKGKNRAKSATQSTRIGHRGVGIALSQNEAKSRRFGMNLPSRAFYEGVNPKTILNKCKRRASTTINDAIGVLASQRVPCTNCRKVLWHLSEALCHLPECIVLLSEALCQNVW